MHLIEERQPQWPRSLGAYGLEPLQHWNRGFESRLRHEIMYALFWFFFPVWVKALQHADLPFKESHQNVGKGS